jgi:hypothetical protein
MPYPTFIIGLGGTGPNVLRLLKSDLIEVYGGVPVAVRLLGIDALEPEAVPIPNGHIYGHETLGLDKSRVLGLLDAARSGSRPDLSDWLDAKVILEQFPSREIIVGGPRQLGRLALWSDLAGGAASHVRGAIAQDIAAIARSGTGVPLEVLVVSSLMGSTGSALLFDIANVVRQEMASVGLDDYTLRGVFTLPRTLPHQSACRWIMPLARCAVSPLCFLIVPILWMAPASMAATWGRGQI